MTILCVIGARGGSQGLPDKNIRPMLGKPLIAWTIEQALATPDIDKVVVSTDSEAIATAARDAGADVPFARPPDLASPEAGKFHVWKHALSACEEIYGGTYDMFVDLDCTAPVRDIEDIIGVMAQLRKRRTVGVDAVFTICPARKNPYFSLVEPDEEGALRMSKVANKKIVRRQDVPPVYEHVGSIYALCPDYIKRADDLLTGRTEGYPIAMEKRFDIDTELDFYIVEALMRRHLERKSDQTEA